MLGEVIKLYLIENGIKQTFLADKLNKPDPVISEMLAGKRAINAIDYYKICNALKVDYDYFMSKLEEV